MTALENFVAIQGVAIAKMHLDVIEGVFHLYDYELPHGVPYEAFTRESFTATLQKRIAMYERASGEAHYAIAIERAREVLRLDINQELLVSMFWYWLGFKHGHPFGLFTNDHAIWGQSVIGLLHCVDVERLSSGMIIALSHSLAEHTLEALPRDLYDVIIAARKEERRINDGVDDDETDQ